MKIGIDIGNVIIGGGGEDTSFFGDNYLETPEVGDAFRSIRELKEAGHEIFLVSKCGAVVQSKTLHWLRYHEFSRRTNVNGTPFFVFDRRDKSPVARALKLDLFIDDRDDIIVSMHWMQYAILFKSWAETMQEIRELT
jgi:hypothetical protein